MNYVYIGATWCPGCVELKPKVLEIFAKNSTQLTEIEVTQENRQQVKDLYRIKCIPALVVLDFDKIVDTWHADMEQSAEDFLRTHLEF